MFKENSHLFFEKKFFELEEREKKLKLLIEEIAGQLKNEGIPVGNDCRLEMNAFQTKKDYKDEIVKDTELVIKREKKWYGENLPLEEIEKKRLKSIGEKLEMIKTVIFYKFLHEKFFVVRTSRYDDIVNNVDNLIIEKDSGSPICAIDEVGDLPVEIKETPGSRYEEKRNKVLEKNKEGGAKIKYGIKILKNERGEKELTLSQLENVPIFYVALPPRKIREALENLNFSSTPPLTDYEKKMFQFFINTLIEEAKFLKKEPDLNRIIKDRIEIFEKAVKNIKKETEAEKF